jgi:hypothetical protein
MKNHTFILMISIIAICTGIIFYSTIGLTPGKEKHSLAGEMQKDTIHRFGVDGATLKYAKKNAEIGDRRESEVSMKRFY